MNHLNLIVTLVSDSKTMYSTIQNLLEYESIKLEILAPKNLSTWEYSKKIITSF